MRILMVSDVYFPRINGVSTSIQTFKTEFEKLGHEIVLIAPDYPQGSSQGSHQDSPQDYAADESILRIKSRSVLFDPEDRMMHYRDILALIPRLREMQFDLVHIHTPFVAHYAGVRLAAALYIPCVATYHTLFEEYLFHYIPFLPRFLLRAFARHFSRTQCNQVDSVVAPSSEIVDLLHRYGVEQAIEIIPTGILSGSFKAGDGDSFRRQFGIPLDRTVLLNVSRVAHEKNLGLLLEMLKLAVEKHPQLCLVIAGEGPARKACMEQAQRLGLNEHIYFVGYLDRATQLIDCYHSADLFVFSSRTETQGLVLLEAMAAGTPVVSVAAMGTRDILIDCPAAQIVEDDAQEFANSLLDILADPARMQSLRDSCETVIQAWDSAAMAGRMLAFYRAVLASQSRESAQVPNEV